jgi:hypothetical protein
MTRPTATRASHLTFRGNLRHTRYGWLRLTPAYSVHLVEEILGNGAHRGTTVLDPFCGTGTTALVCAERGLGADTTDINPFLLWLAETKTRHYSAAECESLGHLAADVAVAIRNRSRAKVWLPALHQIDKWWDRPVLEALGRAMAALRLIEDAAPRPVVDLLRVAFCQTMIEHSQVSFGHQSMSFGRRGPSLPGAADRVAHTFAEAARVVAEGAASCLAKSPSVLFCDARELRKELEPDRYDSVITSPPYPNRMSYIRELRPYMYWLGYLADRRAAGELDWQAIGGTWGSATSRLVQWAPDDPRRVPYRGFADIVQRIGDRSPVLGRYVAKYFHDMRIHAESVFAVTRPGGSVHYIVGNSKFYDVLLPVERIFAALFRAAGFRDPAIRTLRKRTSKKELFEFLVTARKPGAASPAA